MNSRLDKNSSAVQKRIEKHAFDNEEGEEYHASSFGGFPDYFRRKKIKLQNLDAELRANSSDNPQIFRGVVAHINGYTQPSLNDLHHLIVSHGGGFLQYLDGKTMATHVIASKLTPKKIIDFKRYRIVKPAWVVDSVNAGKLLPWHSYRLVDEGERQKVLHVGEGKIESQVNIQQRGYREQSDTSWYARRFKSDSQIHQLPTEPPPSQTHTSGDISSLDPDAIEEALETFERRPATVGISETAEEPRKTNFSNHGAKLTAAEFHNNSVDPKNWKEDDDVEAEDRAYSDDDNDGNSENSLNNVRQVSENLQETTIKRKNAPTDSLDEPKRQRVKTAEEHNAALLADPYIRKTSALNPDFLEQYYRESRLHHLSTWKAELKSQLQALTAAKSSSQKALQKRPAGARRYILHVDFDSFFVAVSLKQHQHLVDKPACVAHGQGSGSEIASCNYPARKYGVKNGMWMKRALELCKDLKVIPYDFPAYEAASKLFYEAIIDTGGVVQSVSIDEALIDVSALCIPAGDTNGAGVREGSIWREQEKADEIAMTLRKKIKEDTGCHVSVGIGGNILLAKVALRKAKPAGQYHVKPEDALEFLGPLQVQDLPGVAYSIGGKLEESGIKFVKDIRELTKERLASILGPKTGEKLWNYARGIDKAEVGDQVVRKSVSAEVNWGIRFETQEQAEEFIDSLCGELNRRLVKEGVKGQHLTMKIMKRAADAPLDPPKHLGHGKCDTFNKSVSLGVATNSKDVISKQAISILRGYNFSAGELRGLGVQMTKLEPLRGAAESSELLGGQKKIQFMSDVPVTVLRNESLNDPIQDLPETPQKAKAKIPGSVPFKPLGYREEDNSPSRKPLNTLGTQFLLPTQVDPEVLKELPADIQSRLALRNVRGGRQDSGESGEDTDSRRKSKAVASDRTFDILPSESQLDPEALAALPDDLRAEVLSEYENKAMSAAGRKPIGHQSVLPQSPRKNRTIQPPPKKPTRGRPRGGGGLAARLRASATTASTLTQSNFVTAHRTGHDTSATDSDDLHVDSEGAGSTTISADFLAALPEDIRKEVLEQHRAAHLRRKGGIAVSRQQKAQRLAAERARLQAQGPAPPRQPYVVSLPPRPRRPTFTSKQLWRLDEMREAVSAWYDAFREDGPYEEDVDALGVYLAQVVAPRSTEGITDRGRGVFTGEGDLEKAVKITRWFASVVAQTVASSSSSAARDAWCAALQRVRAFVSEAVSKRGLGAVDL